MMIYHFEGHNIESARSINEFALKLERTNTLINSISTLGYNLITVHFTLFFTIICSSRVLKKLKKMAADCDGQHEKCNPQRCAEETLSMSKGVRDLFYSINDTAKQLKYFALLIPFLHKITIEWDDFVLDLTISNDAELNKDISLLSNAI